MFPLMPKGEISSMNADDIPMGEHSSIDGAVERYLARLCVALITMFVIDVNILRGLVE